MSSETEFKDPFNVWYFLAAIVALLAFPLLNAICGWFVFYINQ